MHRQALASLRPYCAQGFESGDAFSWLKADTSGFNKLAQR
jgi:hypothetical protein